MYRYERTWSCCTRRRRIDHGGGAAQESSPAPDPQAAAAPDLRPDEDESRKVLASYGIRTVGTALARSLDEAVLQAERIGYPVVLKVVSPDVIFRPDVGGIAVNITSVNVLREEYESIMERVRRFAPRAEIRGVTVQKRSSRDFE